MVETANTWRTPSVETQYEQLTGLAGEETPPGKRWALAEVPKNRNQYMY